MNAIDTNIWIYRHDARDPNKHAVAKNLIANARPLALPWPVGCEFIAASRKLVPLGFDEPKAWAALLKMGTVVTKRQRPCFSLTRISLAFTVRSR